MINTKIPVSLIHKNPYCCQYKTIQLILINSITKYSNHHKPTDAQTHTFLFSHHEDTLPGHPAYWQHSSALDPVIVSSIQVPAHAKVSYLDVTLTTAILSALTLLTPHQTVTCGKIPVHKVEGREELHSRCNLAGHGNEGWITWGKI